jgi:hypothetical protein
MLLLNMFFLSQVAHREEYPSTVYVLLQIFKGILLAESQLPLMLLSPL